MSILKKIISLASVESVADDTSFRAAFVRAFGKLGRVFAFTPYGFDHNPPNGSLAILIQANCDESNRVALITYPQLRPVGLQPGEVKVSNYLTGASVLFKANGDIIINSPAAVNISAPSGSTVTAPTVTVTGNLVVGGYIQAAGNITSTGGDLATATLNFSTHKHTGVQTGAGTSGGPVP